MRLGRCIKAWREINGISGEALALEIGVPQSTISRLERGKMVGGAALVKVMAWAVG